MWTRTPRKTLADRYGRKVELEARLEHTTSDLAAQYEASHHGHSPEAEEDQK